MNTDTTTPIDPQFMCNCADGVMDFDCPTHGRAAYEQRVSTLELENQSLTRRLEEAAKWRAEDNATILRLVEERSIAINANTALRTAAEGARDALEATKAAMLNHAGWNQNFDPTTHRELPMTRPADVALAESKATAALAALRAELDQADSNASNSPTASRESQG